MNIPIRNKFLIFGAPTIGPEEIDEVIDSLHSGWLGTGPKVSRFESDFAAYKGVPENRVAAVNSCTAALHISLIAAGIGPGDEVITTPMTFAATVNAIIHSGAKPVLADIDPLTMNIDPYQIEKKITDRTRAVLPVHMAGRPCDMDSIMTLADKYNLIIIEDCAHAIETEYRGRKAGTFGAFGCFSFYVTKNVVTGEGGMILAKEKDHIARAKMLALHGMSKDAWRRYRDEGYKHYFVMECGFKYNMMDIQASIGIHQLARVEKNWQRRREIWRIYQQSFAELPVVIPGEPENDTRHAYHLYTLLIDEERCGISRDKFLEAMKAHNIGVGVHYMSIPEHPYYQQTFGWKPEHYPNAMRIGRQTVSLPLSPGLSNEDVNDVVEAVSDIICNYGR
ncbi:MAG: DegT/DnrJ/EryC1/StrS family aminotransferase [Deltaproteobacteria bacterium]|nr:DegT/DnrJ/EryC1/StrS family aminotransferase [Deltaproteobacteria bacterium]